MEMSVEHQEQPRLPLHRGVLDGIARLGDPRYHEERHKLKVSGYNKPVDRQSLQHLVDFLDNRGGGDDPSREVVITELELRGVHLSKYPPGGGLEVLRSFVSRSDSTLTKVDLQLCHFGTAQEALQLFAAFETNRTVTDLTIRNIYQLATGGAGLAACLAGLMRNMPQLHRLDCLDASLRGEGGLSFLLEVPANRPLREFNFYGCDIGDEGIRLMGDALAGNRNIEVLDIGGNGFTSNGLDDITRLIESTRLQKVSLMLNQYVFGNEDATRRFARVLSRHGFLKDLNLMCCGLGDGGLRVIVDGLVGNTTMERMILSYNGITSIGLDDITRLVESTRLKTICFYGNEGLFENDEATQRFVTALQHKKSGVQELLNFGENGFPWDEDSKRTVFSSVQNSLARNRQLNHVYLLSTPPPLPPGQQQQPPQPGSTVFLIKTWHKAIAKFATVPNNAGASAIFQLLTARPQLLEKRLKRPTTAAIAAAVSAVQKRRRL